MGLDRTCLPVLVNNTSTSHEAFKPVSFQCQLWVTFKHWQCCKLGLSGQRISGPWLIRSAVAVARASGPILAGLDYISGWLTGFNHDAKSHGIGSHLFSNKSISIAVLINFR